MIILRSCKQEAATEFAGNVFGTSKQRQDGGCPGTYTVYYLPFYKHDPSCTLLFQPMPSSLCLLVTLIYLWSESDMHSASLITIENDTV